MENRSGIAIISVIVIMASIMVLGAGALYLARMNLNIASNVQTNAIARYNAESGLDVAFYQLEVAYRQAIVVDPVGAMLPASLVLGDGQGPDYRPAYGLVDYARDSTNGSAARVVVRGTGPSSAEHVSEALVHMVPGQPEYPPGFAFGLASEGAITVKGSSSYINAGIHGNGGFSLNGNVDDDFYVCEQRDSAGVCTRRVAVPLSDAPVSASPGATQCSPVELCEDGAPKTLISPITVNPDFTERRNRAIEDASSLTGSNGVTFDGVQTVCDVVVNNSAGLAAAIPDLAARPGLTMCITFAGEAHFPQAFDTNGMNIVSVAGLVFPKDGNKGPIFRDSILISTAGRVRTGNDNDDATIIGSRIFSKGALNFNGSQTKITGITTLASDSTIKINGGAPAVAGVDGPAVGLSLIASGDVEINGNANWYVAATVGGTFTQNGTATVYGVIEAKDDITINGGIDIDSGLPVVNDDSLVDGPPRLRVISIR